MIKNSKIVGVNIDPKIYHSVSEARGAINFPISSSALKLFAACPSRWRNGYVLPESDAKNWGALMDTLLTSPQTFDERFAVKPVSYKDAKTGEEKPWNGNSLVCKAWLEDHKDVEPISAAHLAEAQTAVARLRADDVIAAFVDASDKQVWLAAEWHDEKTGLVIPLKALLDFVPRNDTEFYKCLGDAKMVRNAALIPFQRQVFQLGWHTQAAIYTDCYLAAVDHKEDRNTWCFIVQENYPPFQSAKRILSENFMALGRAQYQKAIQNYCLCLKHGIWPDYDMTDEAVQGWGLCSPEPWMESAELFAPKYEFDEPEEETDAPPESEDVPH